MDNPIGVCIDRNPFSTLEELVALVAEAGIARVEWFEAGPETMPWANAETAAQIRSLVQRFELTSQYHAPYEGPFDIARDGDSLRKPESAARLLASFVDRAERLGARLITTHLGTCPLGQDRTEAMRNLMEAVRLAAPELERRRMRLAVENHTPAILDCPLGDLPEDFDWLMENIQSEWVGRTLDIGHAHINGHVDDFLSRPFDRIFNLHVHDNDGKDDTHLPLGKGTTPWDHVLQRIAEKCYHGPITLEFFARPADYLRAIEMIRCCN